MTAQKSSYTGSRVKVCVNGEAASLQTVSPINFQAKADGFASSLVLSAIGMGLAMQSVTQAVAGALQDGQTLKDLGKPEIGTSPDGQAVVGEGAAIATVGLSEAVAAAPDASLVSGEVAMVVLSDPGVDQSDLPELQLLPGLMGEALDPVLGDGGLIDGVLDPMSSEGGAVGGILGPVLGGDGPLALALDPVEGGPGQVGGLFGGLVHGDVAVHGAEATATSDVTMATSDIGEIGAADDGGFVETLIGATNLLAGADSYDDMAAMLSVATDPVLDTLLLEDPLAQFDTQGLLPTDDGLLSDMLDFGLTGALVDEAALVHEVHGANLVPDIEIDSLLSEILDSGERVVGGVNDPLGALLDVAPDTDQGGGHFGADFDHAVDGALQTLIGDGSSEGELLGTVSGENGLLGGHGLFGADDEHG